MHGTKLTNELGDQPTIDWPKLHGFDQWEIGLSEKNHAFGLNLF